MNLKNIIFPGLRQKSRSEMSLQAAQQGYLNSCRNLKLAKLAFWISLFFLVINVVF
mgnify:CR=1